MHRQAHVLLAALLTAVMATACGPDYPNCDDDEDCAEHNEFCVDGQCQQCRDNSNCPTGQQCNSGRCDPIPGYCDATTPCPSGQECVNNRCQAIPQCDDARPCPTGQECVNGQCSAISSYCDASTPCPAGQDCVDNRCQSRPGCSVQPVYFEFDDATLDEGDRASLQSAAQCIQQNGGSNHVTGHADPRGTEEYNLALGDRRARAVRQYLHSLGVNLSSSSRGEEDASGTDEGTWGNDRRADIGSR